MLSSYEPELSLSHWWAYGHFDNLIEQCCRHMEANYPEIDRMHTCCVLLDVISTWLLPFGFRVMADALGGELDAETYELSYNAAASDVADALESAAATLGSVGATRTLSGKLCGKVFQYRNF